MKNDFCIYFLVNKKHYKKSRLFLRSTASVGPEVGRELTNSASGKIKKHMLYMQKVRDYEFLRLYGLHPITKRFRSYSTLCVPTTFEVHTGNLVCYCSRASGHQNDRASPGR